MIILLGFPKTATTSFQELFTKLGYKSYHQMKDHQYIGDIINNNKKQGKPLLSGFSDTDVITQLDICKSKKLNFWPQITDYKRLHEYYPDSVFILNKRDPKKLLTSFKKWNNLHERFNTYNPEILSDLDDTTFINLVNTHYNNVECFFRDIPNVKFITYDIEIDNIEKLGKFIDIKNFKKLPLLNKSKR